MSVKKLLVLGAASLAAISATAVLAGGPDHMAMPTEPTFQKSVYVDLHGGYSESNWNNFNGNGVMGTGASSVFQPTSNGRHGWIGAVDLGYNITQHIAAEGGWFYLPKVAGKGTNNAIGGVAAQSTSVTANIRSWFAYMAAKLSVPVSDHIDLFGKVGVAYRSFSYGTTSTDTVLKSQIGGNGHYWTPVFGTGVQYNWESWMLGVQYMFLPGNSNVNYGNGTATAGIFGAPDAAPSVNLGTVFVGYKFNV